VPFPILSTNAGQYTGNPADYKSEKLFSLNGFVGNKKTSDINVNHPGGGLCGGVVITCRIYNLMVKICPMAYELLILSEKLDTEVK